MSALKFLLPHWPAPARVRAFTTTRVGGASQGPYTSLNLGLHVGDDAGAVNENRARVQAAARIPAAPAWLTQVHGTRIVDAAQTANASEADGSVAFAPGAVCAVLTADCLPVFLCDKAGTAVGVVHAGWRGLAAGAIEAGIAKLARAPADILAWLGPAIGPNAFEVGPEVRTAFVNKDTLMDGAFAPTGDGRYLADIYALARRTLARAGVPYVGGGEYCTVTAPEHFFSYRRDGVCGRMASLIWLESA